MSLLCNAPKCEHFAEFSCPCNGGQKFCYPHYFQHYPVNRCEGISIYKNIEKTLTNIKVLPSLISRVKAEASQLIIKINQELRQAAKKLFQEIDIRQQKIYHLMKNPDSSLEMLIDELSSLSFAERPTAAFSDILSELLEFRSVDSVILNDTANSAFSSKMMETQMFSDLFLEFDLNANKTQRSPANSTSSYFAFFDDQKDNEMSKASKTLDIWPPHVNYPQEKLPKTFNQFSTKEKVKMLKQVGIRIEDHWHVLQAKKSNDSQVVIVCKYYAYGTEYSGKL